MSDLEHETRLKLKSHLKVTVAQGYESNISFPARIEEPVNSEGRKPYIGVALELTRKTGIGE